MVIVAIAGNSQNAAVVVPAVLAFAATTIAGVFAVISKLEDIERVLTAHGETIDATHAMATSTNERQERVKEVLEATTANAVQQQQATQRIEHMVNSANERLVAEIDRLKQIIADSVPRGG